MRRAVALLSIVLAACQLPVGPPHGDAVPMDVVPAAFESYWAEVVACSGRARPSGVTYWIATDGPYRFDVDGAGAMAAYETRARRMIFTEYALEQPNVIRHEMLHAVLGSSAGGQHPREFFNDRCGSIVTHPP